MSKCYASGMNFLFMAGRKAEKTFVAPFLYRVECLRSDQGSTTLLVQTTSSIFIGLKSLQLLLYNDSRTTGKEEVHRSGL